MKPNDFKKLLIRRYEKKVRRPILVESEPGLGKTQLAAQAAKELNIGFMSIHAPLLQPEDYGFPVISKERDNVDFIVSSSKFPIVGSDCPDDGIFLIDEISQADASAQKILANLVHEREIHGKKLKKNWLIVTTGNRTKDRSGANRILGHLGNRVTRVTLEASLDDWTQWSLANDVNPEVIAFIRFRPELLCQYDANADVSATPRAWVDGISQSLGVTDKDLEFEVFKGDVGEGPASEFLAFLKIYRELPSPDAIILNPTKSDVPTKPAVLFAVCGALSHKTTEANFDRVMKYIKRLPPEFSVLYVRDVQMLCPEIVHTKEYIRWATDEGAKLLT